MLYWLFEKLIGWPEYEEIAVSIEYDDGTYINGYLKQGFVVDKTVSDKLVILRRRKT